MTNKSLDELRHSVRLYMILMNGPNAQLAALLLKTLDFIDDEDERRRNDEMAFLSLVIVQAIAIHTERLIDTKKAEVEHKGMNFPSQLKQKGDNLLIEINRTKDN